MQIAVIPRDEELYCLLKPMAKIKGIKNDEPVAFKVDESGEESTINLVSDYLMLITTYLRKIKKRKTNINEVENENERRIFGAVFPETKRGKHLWFDRRHTRQK